MCGRFSLGSGFLYINEHLCKQICPVWLQGRKDWIHAPVEAPCGVGVGGSTPVLLWGSFVSIPLPPDFFSYLGLVLSPSRLQTRMSLNSSLESQAFVMRGYTGNSNLFLVDARITKAWDSRDELRDMRVLSSEAKDSLR